MKQLCNYCGGHTFDDDRGNCGACGAPRGESARSFIDYGPAIGLIDVTAFGDPERVYIQGPFTVGDDGLELPKWVEILKNFNG